MLLLELVLLFVLLGSAHLLPLRPWGLAKIQICLRALLSWFLHAHRDLGGVSFSGVVHVC